MRKDKCVRQYGERVGKRTCCTPGSWNKWLLRKAQKKSELRKADGRGDGNSVELGQRRGRTVTRYMEEGESGIQGLKEV